ncbi:hypothetical protein GCM10023082_10460 [Streptomyces tremellae]|uniref:Uncharacterized protein n=1 Tax=Streptomyces tremellae TaxID=1124239 RepID=A0ABP7E7V9_9ACTN
MDVGARSAERGSDVGADGSGAHNSDFHVGLSISVRETERSVTLRVLSTYLSTIYCLQYGSGGDNPRDGTHTVLLRLFASR